MEMNDKEMINTEKMNVISGGDGEEQYYAEFEKFGHLDTEAHLLEGANCSDCGRGRLKFWKYQPGPFGNREAVYYCELCHEYTLTALRK